MITYVLIYNDNCFSQNIYIYIYIMVTYVFNEFFTWMIFYFSLVKKKKKNEGKKRSHSQNLDKNMQKH